MYLSWLALAVLLELLALADLIGSIVERNSEFVRNADALIVLAAITWAISTAALARALRHRRRRAEPAGSMAAALTLAAVLMNFLYAVASLASGPL